LVKYPDIAGMVGLWAYNAPAIFSVLKDADRLTKVQVVSFDEEDDTLAGIAAGTVHGTVVQQSYEFGYQSMKLMAKYLSGDTAFLTPEKLIYVPTQTITAGNVAGFRTKLQQVRGK
jgi:ribose transport system substrate-binding protein